MVVWVYQKKKAVRHLYDLQAGLQRICRGVMKASYVAQPIDGPRLRKQTHDTTTEPLSAPHSSQ